jgi:hypothetical protein
MKSAEFKASPSRAVQANALPSHGALLQRKCACGGNPGASGECESCRKKRLGLARQAAPAGQVPAMAPPIVHETLRSPGRPLDGATRAFFEPRLGSTFGASSTSAVFPAAAGLPISQPGDRLEQEADRVADRILSGGVPAVGPGSGCDLGRIRIHTDRQAAESAQAVGALAYTVGQDVVFGAGLYSPGSPSGLRLLAHELAHTVQQGAGLYRQPKLTGTHDPTPKFSPPGVCYGSAFCNDVKMPRQLLTDARDDANKAQHDEREKACKAPEKAACRADGHAKRAVEAETLLKNYDPNRLNNAQGIFVNRDLEGDFGALTVSCSSFTPPLASTGTCITIPAKMEENAKLFNSTTGPLTIDGMERGQWRERTLEILVHEAGHTTFRAANDASFQAHFSDATPNFLGKARPTCKTDENSRMNVYLSLNELAAMVQEFPLRIENMRINVALDTPEKKNAEMEEWRDHRIRGKSQSITNSLRAVRCLCGCEDADDMIRDTLTSAMSSWDVNQKNDLHREMRDPKWNDLDLRWPFIAPPILRPAP